MSELNNCFLKISLNNHKTAFAAEANFRTLYKVYQDHSRICILHTALYTAHVMSLSYFNNWRIHHIVSSACILTCSFPCTVFCMHELNLTLQTPELLYRGSSRWNSERCQVCCLPRLSSAWPAQRSPCSMPPWSGRSDPMALTAIFCPITCNIIHTGHIHSIMID